MDEDQLDDKTSLTKTRDGKGRFDRDPETAKRDAEAADLRSKSWTYPQIGAHLGMSKQAAQQAVQRVLDDTLEEPAANLRQFEREKLDRLERIALDELAKQHFVVSHGKVVCIDEEPLHDTAAVLACVDRLVRISESRRKLDGLDSATKLDVTGGVTYEIIGLGVDRIS